MGTFKNLGHHSFLDVVAAACHEAHPHTVAGEGEQRVALCHKHGSAVVVGYETVFAVSLADEFAFLYLTFEVESVGVVAYPAQHIVPCHVFHSIYGEHLGGVGVESQGLEYLFEAKHLVGLLREQLQQHFGDFLLGQSFL